MMTCRILVVLFFAALGACSPRIVQPGAPGTASRTIARKEAVDLSRVQFTPADVKFIQGMIHHHAQALDMTALIPSRTSLARMRVLGQRIEISQSDEINMMRRWLEARGQEVPDIHEHHMPGAQLMPGMLAPEEMDRLAAAKGAEFDRLWLQSMIKHHDGALIMVDDLFSVPGAGQESEIFAFASDVVADQKAPAGTPFPPERPNEARPPNETPGQRAPAEDAAASVNPPPHDPAVQSALSFANSDLAFSRDHLIMGSFHGFNMYDVEDPKKARILVSVVCPGGQGDVSVYGNLLFMSVEQTRGRIDCGTQGVEAPVSKERFRGVRIFDISDLRNPRQVAAVQTCRGSHTHTLVVDPKDKANVYIYGQGTGQVRSTQELAGCSGEAPEKDLNTALFSIDVIQVPLAAPQSAKIVNRPRIFADTATGNIAGLWRGGDHGPGTQR